MCRREPGRAVVIGSGHVPGATPPVEITSILSDVLPPVGTITAAFAVAFERDRFLLTDLVVRGLDIPGGHVEPGETPEEARRVPWVRSNEVLFEMALVAARSRLG